MNLLAPFTVSWNAFQFSLPLPWIVVGVALLSFLWGLYLTRRDGPDMVRILWLLQSEGREMRPREIAHRVGLPEKTVERFLARLTGLGMVDADWEAYGTPNPFGAAPSPFDHAQVRLLYRAASLPPPSVAPAPADTRDTPPTEARHTTPRGG